MINKAWQFRVAWPGIELATYRVAGRRLIHYSNSGLLNARASQELDLALTPNLGILRRLELNWLKLWWTRLGDRLHISLTDAYYVEMRVRWFDSFGQKVLQRIYNRHRDVHMKSGSTFSVKDRLWASFLVRNQQYIPCRKNSQMWKLDRDWASVIDGVSIDKMYWELSWYNDSVPASHAEGRGFESTLSVSIADKYFERICY